LIIRKHHFIEPKWLPTAATTKIITPYMAGLFKHKVIETPAGKRLYEKLLM